MYRSLSLAGRFIKSRTTSQNRNVLPILQMQNWQRRGIAGSENDGGKDAINDMIATYQGADHEFEPYREREHSSDCISYHERPTEDIMNRGQPMHLNSAEYEYVDAEANRRESSRLDSHVDNYDKQGTINLHSVQESQIPEPFEPATVQEIPGPVNMPGGHEPQMSLKYTSEQRHGRNDPAGEIV